MGTIREGPAPAGTKRETTNVIYPTSLICAFHLDMANPLLSPQDWHALDCFAHNSIFLHNFHRFSIGDPNNHVAKDEHSYRFPPSCRQAFSDLSASSRNIWLIDSSNIASNYENLDMATVLENRKNVYDQALYYSVQLANYLLHSMLFVDSHARHHSPAHAFVYMSQL